MNRRVLEPNPASIAKGLEYPKILLVLALLTFTLTGEAQVEEQGAHIESLKKRVLASGPVRTGRDVAIAACEEAMAEKKYSLVGLALENPDSEVRYFASQFLRKVPITERKEIMIAALLGASVWPDPETKWPGGNEERGERGQERGERGQL